MRCVLDTCVLFPAVMREALFAVAETEAFTPLWSERILGEWDRAGAKHGPLQGLAAREAVTQARLRFPGAIVPAQPGLESRLHLPDEADIHVLASAIAGSADCIVTLNAADFPRGTLRAEGVERRDPDGLLWEFWSQDPAGVGAALETLRREAEARDGVPRGLTVMLKRAGLTRLAKAMRQD
ncbi:RSP_2648 family PIN domain-containing protein [Szabonella alba]|uniref:PIN domain-containing protein n=1 Tax=Szabonella alba TaxID=2804194 RepID=A0A8K0VA28_9RHOB|nr:PIN domain-containing protein [Szabonella alba]MBL4917891.1 PIN domain-containing protein [Szabonella alba]